jgi:hypothetical protein
MCVPIPGAAKPGGHQNRRRRAEPLAQLRLGPLLVAPREIVETAAEQRRREAQQRPPLRPGPALVAARAHVGGDRFDLLESHFGRSVVPGARNAPAAQFRRKGLVRLAGDEQRDDPLALAHLLKQFDLPPHPARRGRVGRTHDDQMVAPRQCVLDLIGEIRGRRDFVLVAKEMADAIGKSLALKRLRRAIGLKLRHDADRPLTIAWHVAIADESGVAVRFVRHSLSLKSFPGADHGPLVHGAFNLALDLRRTIGFAG